MYYTKDDLPDLGKYFLNELNENNRTELLSILNITLEDNGLFLNFDNMDDVDSICFAVSSLYNHLSYFQFKSFENTFLNNMSMELQAAVWNVVYNDAYTYDKYVSDKSCRPDFVESIMYLIQQKLGW